jgi:hypothetical protein
MKVGRGIWEKVHACSALIAFVTFKFIRNNPMAELTFLLVEQNKLLIT